MVDACENVSKAYDAAGRLVREGSKTYRYGYLDKVMSVTDNGSTYTYEYHADGQLATATYPGGTRSVASETESFLWDGLALIQRGDEHFINEPHIGGGNPVASSKGTSYFNDMLGTTIGSKSNGKYSAAVLSAFGENHLTTKPHNHQTFFTGKPYVEGLGHAFLMRNYRAGLAKWQSADPMGYPDGWNQLAYCNNAATSAVDLWGCDEWKLYFDDDWWDSDPLEIIPQELKPRSSTEHMLEGVMDAMASATELGLLLRVQTSTQTGETRNRQSEKAVTYAADGTIKHEQWRSWTERSDTTTFTCECVCTPAIRTAADMLANVGTLLSSYGRIFKVIKIGGRMVDAASDVGTDSGLVSLLGNAFQEHEVLFSFGMGTKVDYYRSAYYFHLRSYSKVKE